jgi:hypothetical protein
MKEAAERKLWIVRGARKNSVEAQIDYAVFMGFFSHFCLKKRMDTACFALQLERFSPIQRIASTHPAWLNFAHENLSPLKRAPGRATHNSRSTACDSADRRYRGGRPRASQT